MFSGFSERIDRKTLHHHLQTLPKPLTWEDAQSSVDFQANDQSSGGDAKDLPRCKIQTISNLEIKAS